MKNFRFSGCELPHDCLTSRLRPHREFDWEFVGTGCKAFSITGGHGGVRNYWLSGPCIDPIFNIECPEQFGDRMEKVSVRQVDPGAQSSAIAYVVY